MRVLLGPLFLCSLIGCTPSQNSIIEKPIDEKTTASKPQIQSGFGHADIAANPDLRYETNKHTIALQHGDAGTAKHAQPRHTIPFTQKTASKHRHCVTDKDVHLEILDCAEKVVETVKGGECKSPFMPSGCYNYRVTDTRADKSSPKATFMRPKYATIDRETFEQRMQATDTSVITQNKNTRPLAQSASTTTTVSFSSASGTQACTLKNTNPTYIQTEDGIGAFAIAVKSAVSNYINQAGTYIPYYYLEFSGTNPNTPPAGAAEFYIYDCSNITGAGAGSIALVTSSNLILTASGGNSVVLSPNTPWSNSVSANTFKYAYDNQGHVSLTTNDVTKSLVGATNTGCSSGVMGIAAATLGSPVLSTQQCAGPGWGVESVFCNGNPPSWAIQQACDPGTAWPTGATATKFSFTEEYEFEIGGNCIACQIAGITLSDYDLSNVDFTSAYLYGAVFRTAFMPGANLSHVQATSAVFDYASFFNYDGINPSLQNAILVDATFIGANLMEINLNGSTMDGTKFTGAILLGATFAGVTINDNSPVDFSCSLLVGADFSGLQTATPKRVVPNGSMLSFQGAIVNVNQGCVCLDTAISSTEKSPAPYPFSATPVSITTTVNTTCPNGAQSENGCGLIGMLPSQTYVEQNACKEQESACKNPQRSRITNSSPSCLNVCVGCNPLTPWKAQASDIFVGIFQN